MIQKLLRIIVLSALSSGVVSLNAASWYVDKAATGANNGASWLNAWNSFSKVVWGSSGVKAGDTLYISGGSTSKTYTETWSVGASGTATSPITIAVDAANASHNGVVIFDYNNLGDTASSSVVGITCTQNYVTFNGNVNGACHLAVNNLRNINVNTGTSGIGGWNTTGFILDHVASTNCNNPVRMTSSTNFRIRNCQFRQVRGDAAIGCAGSTGGFDASLVYNNVIETLYNSAQPPGASYAYGGPDGLCCGSGVSIYNNLFVEAKTTVYTSSQHPDMIQNQGNYIKVYNNEFRNIGDSAFDYGYGQTDYHDIWIYNNLFRIVTTIDPYPEFIRVYSNPGTIKSIYNFKICNNTFVDCKTWSPVQFYMYNGNPTGSGNEIKNNIFYNCGNGSYFPNVKIENSSGFTASSFAFDGNVYFNSSSEAHLNLRGVDYTASAWVAANEPKGTTRAPTFVAYSAFALGNDFRLSSTDTVALNAGVDLRSYFTTDRFGVSRPQGSVWDIGASEFVVGSGTSLPPVANAGSDRAITLPANSTGLSGTATDPNGTTPTTSWSRISGPGTATFSAPNSLVTTATFSTAGAYTLRLTASDGSLSASDDVVVTVNSQPTTTSALLFHAEVGVVTNPFVVNGGYIEQSALTGVTDGGRATYTFAITNSGSYTVTAGVNAPADASNSIFVNIDAEPTDPYMIWDIPFTNGFESRVCAWRGNGTFELNEFTPKLFALSTGVHTLIVRGREGGTQLDWFELKRVNPPAPPGNLHLVLAP